MHVRQQTSGACGSIAALHAVLNSEWPSGRGGGALRPGTAYHRFQDGHRKLVASGGGDDGVSRLFQEDQHLWRVNESVARGQQGQGRGGSYGQDGGGGGGGDDGSEEEASHHFVSFVWRSGRVYEQDSCDAQPYDLGPCEDPTLLLEHVAEVIKGRMEKAGGTLNFNVFALTRTGP